ncbi:hypothetical protein [Paenibacillus sp. 1P03SA]|uniref:hypothetical protein n=1 Tax=Paenibacillus sp. 1P03SA TaxID=3132294 RepID=UPI00399F4610
MKNTNQWLAFLRGSEGSMLSLTTKGVYQLIDRVISYRVTNGLAPDAEIDGEWYCTLRDELFAPELEGVTWVYIKEMPGE